jgi:hypothetical protein
MATEQTATTTATAPDTPPEAAPAAGTTAQDDDGLAAAAAEHTAELTGMLAKPAQSAQAEPGADEQGAAPQAEGDAQDKPPEGETGEAAKPEDGQEENAKADDKEPDKPADKPEEESVAGAIAKYVRQHTAAVAREKEAKAKLEQIEKDRAELEGQRQTFQQSQRMVEELARLATDSPIDAIENLLGTAALIDEHSTIVSDLLDRITARKNGAPAVSDEQRIAAAVERAVRQERETRTKAEEEAQRRAQAERATKREAGLAAYLVGLAAEFEDNADSFPFLQGDPILREEYPKIDAWMQEQFSATGQIPKPMDVLKHFEAERESAALAKIPILEKTGKLAARKAEAAVAQVAPAKHPSAAVATGVDSRGKAPPPAKGKSLEEEREEIARRLDAQFAGK